ncbi:MAG: DUF6923 family protein, partial [Flavicella sp.]
VVDVNSQQSGDVNFSPPNTTIDVLLVTNNGSGQVDFKFTSAVHINKIILVNNSSGTVKFRAGGNFPYPTITYCTIDDPSNSAVFENTVNQSTGTNCATSSCFSSGATLSSISVNVSHNLIWYDAATGGNQLSSSHLLSDGSIYYAANNDGAGCESTRTAVVACVDATPFNCVSEAYLFQTNDVFSVDLASGNATQVATDIVSGSINAVGYNPKDGFIWGSVSSPTKSIIRIGKNFSTKVFSIPELPTANRYIGDVNENGIYYLKPGGTTVYKIDIDPSSSNYASSVGTLTMSQGITIHDWAFNPQDDLLYAVEKDTNILYRINPNNGTVTSLGEVPILSGNSYTYGAVYFDYTGNFYVSSNQTGTIYIVYSVHNLTSGSSISSNLFAAGPSSSSNDGARCPTASVPQEICDNNIDDDGDGLVDCDDYVCSNIGNCEEIDDIDGGDNGGLESNNRLSQKIANRNYRRGINRHSFDKTKARKIGKSNLYGKKMKKSTVLEDFIPLDIIPNSSAVESSPVDLTEITNASKVFAVDYIRGNSTIAAALFLETDKGAYEHSKYICDRLQGAQILSISSFQFFDKPFSIALIKQPNGTKEYVMSYAAKISENSFAIESHWNLDKFDPEGHYYNFQFWSYTIDVLHKLVTESFNLLASQKAIKSVSTTQPPSVYIKKAKYERGKLVLEITNTIKTSQLALSGGIRKSETNPTEQVSYNMSIDDKSFTSIVSVDTGSFFDGGFRLESGIANTPDDLFISDGTWGVDDYAKSSKVKSFEVLPHQAKDDTGYSFERAIEFVGETADYIGVYRSFTPRFAPVDLSDFNTLELQAKGTGMLSIQLVKPAISDWEQRHKINLMLSENMTNYKLPLSEFKNNLGKSIDLSEVSSLLFVMRSHNGKTIRKELSLNSLKFTETPVDLMETDKITVSTLTDDYSLKVRFTVFNFDQHTLRVYDSNGSLVTQKIFYPKTGVNTVAIETKYLSPGVYIVHLSSASKLYPPEKCILP